jgi:LmbE family N-acetylglucosaminyl deacetylase
VVYTVQHWILKEKMNIFSTHDKVLFIYAHMDDETILSYGTMKYLNEIGCSINVLCLCGNGR